MLHCEFAQGRHSGGAVQVGEDSQYDARSHIKKMSNTMFVYKVVEAFRHLQEQSGQLEGTKDVTEWTAGFGFFFLCLCSVCLLSKLFVDPTHRVLMSFPLFLFVPCKTWLSPSQACTDLCVPCSGDSQP